MVEYEYIASEKGTLGTVFAKNLVIKVIDGVLVVNAVTEKESSSVHSSSFLCPSSVIWQGEYTLAGEKALYIKGA